MPVITFFYGIIVQMFWDESSHNLPRIHVEYQHHSAVVDLQGNYIKGELPPNKKKLLDAWIELHAEELQTCWTLMQKGEPHIKIEPLK
jgi:hypothetical protein